MPSLTPFRRVRGFTLIEILVTLVVTAVGMLGLAGFVVRATTLSADAVQRARAAVLVNDMAARINSNRPIAANFVDGVVHGASVTTSCAGLAQAAFQLCEWNNMLAGANDALTKGGVTEARSLGYRGCVTGNPDPNLYTITVAWGSLTPGAQPVDRCAAGVFGDEAHRRVLRLQVRVARLGT